MQRPTNKATDVSIPALQLYSCGETKHDYIGNPFGPGFIMIVGRPTSRSLCENARVSCHAMRARALLIVILCSSVRGAVIQKIFGANTSKIGFASSGGGTHVYLTGTDLGSAFAVRHSDSNPRPSPFASIHPVV